MNYLIVALCVVAIALAASAVAVTDVALHRLRRANREEP